MPSRFLSGEQRTRYGRYAGDPTEEQLARHFYLDAADRELVGQKAPFALSEILIPNGIFA
jgi:hypothetical protein